jgi:hypothetical protein
MNEPLDELYLVWLYSQFGNPTARNLKGRYLNLARKLYTTEFVWFVPNDDSRLEDGKALRVEFLQDAEIPEVDPDWMDLGCSFLELMVGLSRRLGFQTDSHPSRWFWKLLENIGLNQYDDANPFSDEDVEEVTECVIWRTYRRDGHGGFFPLKKPKQDQRKIELWYQLSAYIIENDY